MYGGHAHLFHVIDPHYGVPRWVVGPSVGAVDGWAFAESDAMTPQEPGPPTSSVLWVSWDGFEWHTCSGFRFSPCELVEGVPMPINHRDGDDYDFAAEFETDESAVVEGRLVDGNAVVQGRLVSHVVS